MTAGSHVLSSWHKPTQEGRKTFRKGRRGLLEGHYLLCFKRKIDHSVNHSGSKYSWHNHHMSAVASHWGKHGTQSWTIFFIFMEKHIKMCSIFSDNSGADNKRAHWTWLIGSAQEMIWMELMCVVVRNPTQRPHVKQKSLVWLQK